MASVLGFAAAAWGLLMALAPLLQIRRTVVRRSSADLSLGNFAVLLPGFALWVAYGWAGADWPLVVPNAVALAVGLGTVLVGHRLRGRDPRRPADRGASPRDAREAEPRRKQRE